MFIICPFLPNASTQQPQGKPIYHPGFGATPRHDPFVFSPSHHVSTVFPYSVSSTLVLCFLWLSYPAEISLLLSLLWDVLGKTCQGCADLTMQPLPARHSTLNITQAQTQGLHCFHRYNSRPGLMIKIVPVVWLSASKCSGQGRSMSWESLLCVRLC